MLEDAKLKPCPFCGKTPKIDPSGSHNKCYYVECSCSADGPMGTRDEAIAAWNRRTSEPWETPFADIQDNGLVNSSIEEGKRVTIGIRLDNLQRDVAPDISINIVASEVEHILRRAGFPLRVTYVASEPQEAVI